MDAVLDNWLGPAIGGAVGAASWVAGQVWDLGETIVDTVVDAVTGATQPKPYEEWLNAPVPTQQPQTNDFRTGNETTRRPTVEEVITNAARQETQTGVSSPLGPDDPYEYKPIPPAPQNKDPQAPLTPDFQPIPEKAPVKTADSNVILTYYNPGAANPDSDPGIQVYAGWKGDKKGPVTKAFNQVTFSVVPVTNPDGTGSWTLRAQFTLGGANVQVLTWNTGEFPAFHGELSLNMVIPAYGEDFNLLDTKNAFGGTRVRVYSLAQADLPELFTKYAEIQPNQQEITGLTPVNTTPLETNADGAETPVPPEWAPFLPFLPFLPDILRPLTVNNPTVTPQIGRDGKPIINIKNVTQTKSTVHVVGGKQFNGGAIRKSIAGVAQEVGRIEGKTAATVEKMESIGPKIDQIVDFYEFLQLLQDIFEQPLPEKSYTLTSVCEPTADGQPPPSHTVTLPAEKWADRLITMGDVMPELLQAHKNYKQPTCGKGSTPLEGTWISTRWESDGNSPGGTKPLRKLFRYRSKSTRTPDELQLYWRDFVWQAGPVCVQHKDAWWGNPQVWAATEEEGKRVLRFAAGEAGLDPDSVGRWVASSSRSARYGMPGRMRLEEYKGERWVTRRDGPSGLPEL